VLVYRIAKKKYKDDLSGNGAALYGGRWNYPGFRVIYTSETIALAVLEFITKAALKSNEIKNLYISYIEIEKGGSLKQLSAEQLSVEELTQDWYRYPAPDALKDIGTDWLVSGESLLLKVPAVSAPESFNILINPLHPEFNKVRVLKSVPYLPDNRMTDLR
jgi:RES domain-containing protein